MGYVVLFDLDMTLVDTSALAQARQARQWNIVKASYNLIRPFSTGTVSPHELPAGLRAAGHRVGIVTSSPRWYAEEILKMFTIPHEVLVAYEDTENHKPHPDPIEEALRRLLVTPSENVYYVGDDVGDFEAAYHAGIKSIGVGWSASTPYEMSSAAPDLLIHKPSRLLKAPDFPSLGYVGERKAEALSFHPHGGSVLECETDPVVMALGRYFHTGDPRHATSALSSAVLSLKNDDTTAPMFGRAIGEGLAGIRTPFDFVVPVPPKPSQQRHRFEAVLKEASNHAPGLKVYLDGLKVIKEVEGYKQMSPLERSSAIRGAFASDYDWKKGRVLLVDDVYTTGSTTNECIRILKASGARSVAVLALAKDQRAFMHKICECGRSMKVRTRAADGVKFWGCSGYPDECRRTESMSA